MWLHMPYSRSVWQEENFCEFNTISFGKKKLGTKFLLAYRVVLDGNVWQILVCQNAAHLQSSPPNFLPTKHSSYTVAMYLCIL